MGKQSSIDEGAASSLADAIVGTIRSSKGGKAMDLKALRTAALASSGADDDDKASKKLFKAAVKLLEKSGRVSLNADGVVKLAKSERTTGGDEKSDKKKKKKKEKKRKRESKDEGNEVSGQEGEDDGAKRTKEAHGEEDGQDGEPNDAEIPDNDAEAADDADADVDPAEKNKPCKNNPQGITRLFLGNLPFAITEETLNTHLKDTVTHIKWITDKDTGRFYGSAFCEVRTSKDAAMAMAKINGTQVMGRPIKINYAPMRPGEEGDWPPRSRVITGGKMANAAGGKGQAGGTGINAMSAKPDGCCKLFIGNLSYDIDDDGIAKFFMKVEAELKAVRWLYHRDSGDFKGCGYVDFWNSEACEKAATLNGKDLLGRPIRIDWAE